MNHGHITDCKLDSVVYAGVCVVILDIVENIRFYTSSIVRRLPKGFVQLFSAQADRNCFDANISNHRMSLVVPSV